MTLEELDKRVVVVENSVLTLRQDTDTNKKDIVELKV